MKTSIITFVLFVCLLISGHATQAADKYTEAMQKNIEAVYNAETVADFQNIVNAFERIASAEKTKWEPYYYASFGYVLMSSKEKDVAKKDAFLDQAMTLMQKAQGIAPTESEVSALEGFIYMMRLVVDPATRGQQYSGLSMQSYEKALTMNPENPRALALKARMQYGSAQFFSASTEEACGTVKSALEKFATFKSDNPLAPQWGKQMAEGLAEKCK